MRPGAGSSGLIRISLWASHFPRLFRHRIEVEPIEYRPVDLARQFEMRQLEALFPIELNSRAVTGMVVTQ
jgi:hypothetical protein